jgi:hypothetical protein
MRWLPHVLTPVIFASGAIAPHRPDTLRMTHTQARRLVQPHGGVALSSGSFAYEVLFFDEFTQMTHGPDMPGARSRDLDPPAPVSSDRSIRLCAGW